MLDRTAPVRLQLSRAAGFRLQDHSLAVNGRRAVKVDRTTAFGNPYLIGQPVSRAQVRRWGWDFSPEGLTVICKDAAEATRCFAHCLLRDEAIHDHVRNELGGCNVACWCDLPVPPTSEPVIGLGPLDDLCCHGDILLWLANSTRDDVRSIHQCQDALFVRYANDTLRALVEAFGK
jgi:Domain of unknown function (DUF4326)